MSFLERGVDAPPLRGASVVHTGKASLASLDGTLCIHSNQLFQLLDRYSFLFPSHLLHLHDSLFLSHLHRSHSPPRITSQGYPPALTAWRLDATSDRAVSPDLNSGKTSSSSLPLPREDFVVPLNAQPPAMSLPVPGVVGSASSRNRISSRFEGISDLWYVLVYLSAQSRAMSLQITPAGGDQPHTSHTLLTAHSALPSIAEDTILATLRERYVTSQQYTSLGSSAIVSMNPLASLPSNTDSSLQDYIHEYFRSAGDDVVGGEAGSSKERLPPHIFRHALNAYYNMRRTGQDQIMLLR